MSNITVIGATGSIGSAIVREALDRGHQVTAVVRDPNRVEQTHPALTVRQGDALDPASVTAVAQGQDVVISAVGGGDGATHQATIKPAAVALVEGLRALRDDAPRLIAVGGAGSLNTPDGKQVWDSPGLPEDLLKIMHAHGDALDHYRTVTDLNWVNVSPAANIAPGERTGNYRTGLDDLLTDASGNSAISTQDFAAAILDEVEQPQHAQRRISVAY